MEPYASSSVPAVHRPDSRLLVLAGVSAAVVVLSIVIGTIVGELPEALWFALVPVGMLGGAVVCLASLVTLLARRTRR